MIVSDQAYVLHVAHYQETSALVRLLSREQGIVGAVVRGVHSTGKKANALRAALQMGNLVECQWGGKSSLKTVYALELVQVASLDGAMQFVCLSYVHELLLYFLREGYSAGPVYDDYQALLAAFASGQVEVALRNFEFRLLDNMGYGIDFSHDIGNDNSVQPGLRYRLVPGSGVTLAAAVDRQTFCGEDLLAIAQRNYAAPALLPVAKKISRQLLAFHMEGRQIRARQQYQDLFGQ